MPDGRNLEWLAKAERKGGLRIGLIPCAVSTRR